MKAKFMFLSQADTRFFVLLCFKRKTINIEINAFQWMFLTVLINKSRKKSRKKFPKSNYKKNKKFTKKSQKNQESLVIIFFGVNYSSHKTKYLKIFIYFLFIWNNEFLILKSLVLFLFFVKSRKNRGRGRATFSKKARKE